MKGIMKKIISIVLVLATLLSMVIPVSAARPGATQFLSELQMAQASTADEAKMMLISAGYKVIDKDLNPDSQVSVYLGYKTSTNVEDAITDIAVMNMNGGYGITQYDKILADTKNEYKAMIASYRVAANEFAENYKAGDKDAMLAYRQLNYYYIEKDGKKTYMGDYMLNFPTTDDEFVDILFKGNLFVLNNIRSLLAMGTGESNVSIKDRVAELTHDQTIYDNMNYHVHAKKLYEMILTAKDRVEETEETIIEIEKDETLSEEEKRESVEVLLSSLQNMVVFRNLIESYAYGDSTYGEYLNSVNYVLDDYSVLYPIIAALTPGQRALVEFGQIMEIVIYDTIRKSDEDLEKELEEVEEEFGEINVFHGTDLEALTGSFAITDEAMRIEAATGQSWINANDGGNQANKLVLSIMVGLGGVVTTLIAGSMLKDAITTYMEAMAETIPNPVYQQVLEGFNDVANHLEAAKKTMEYMAQHSQGTATATAAMRGTQRAFQTAMENYNNAKVVLESTPKTIPQPADASIWPIVGTAIGVIVGVAMMAYSITTIVKIANSYKVEYTDIPLNMIDVVNTENGNRFIRYRVVNSLYEEDGTVKTRPGDTNGYDGRQWVALYYTKNYEAGKCLLSNVDFPQNEKDFGKYTPVHEFGKVDVCYNVNKYTKRNSLTSSTTDITQDVFLAFQNSNAKKAAETEIPTIVGSVFNYGVVAISALVGFGAGMGVMALIKTKKKKEKSDENKNN